MTGACVVYMSNDVTIDATNGAICHQASVTIDDSAVADDYYSMAIGGHSMFTVPASQWIGPGTFEMLTALTSNEVTNDKYGLTYSPV